VCLQTGRRRCLVHPELHAFPSEPTSLPVCLPAQRWAQRLLSPASLRSTSLCLHRCPPMRYNRSHSRTVLACLLYHWSQVAAPQRVELDLQSTGRGFKSYSGQKLRNNLGQLVHTYVPLSPSSITWYRPRGRSSAAGKACLAESNGSLPPSG